MAQRRLPGPIFNYIDGAAEAVEGADVVMAACLAQNTGCGQFV